MRHRLALVAATAATALAVAPAAWAHSPTDFLKVSVGRPSTVLLPPMTAVPGRVEVTIASPASFRLIAASAGPGWRTRLAPTAAVLDGRSTAGRSLLVSITGRASRPGNLPVDVQVASPRGPSMTYHWRLTALAGYAQPVSSLAGAARPDAAVAIEDRHSYRLWPLSLVLASVALLVLVVRRPRAA